MANYSRTTGNYELFSFSTNLTLLRSELRNICNVKENPLLHCEFVVNSEIIERIIPGITVEYIGDVYITYLRNKYVQGPVGGPNLFLPVIAKYDLNLQCEDLDEFKIEDGEGQRFIINEKSLRGG